MTNDFRPLRQTAAWARFMARIGWTPVRRDEVLFLVREFPLNLGSFIKVLDLDRLPAWSTIDDLVREYRCWKLHVQSVFEAGSDQAKELEEYLEDHGLGETDPLAPSTTRLIDLTKSERRLMDDFQDAKRRAVRKAERKGTHVQSSEDIEAYASLWRSCMRKKGDWLASTKEIISIWEAFEESDRYLLVTHDRAGDPDAGVLYLRNGWVLHYMFAASTDGANSRKAPTVLVWEGIRLGQRLGCTVFDFEGVQDERYADKQKSWQGFSRFKARFGGKKRMFVAPKSRLFLRLSFS